MSDRPHADLIGNAQLQPGMRFGDPHIHGVSCAAVASLVWAGEDPTTVADEYSLPSAAMTRADVIVACWVQARYGDWLEADCGRRRVRRTWRDRWGRWLDDNDAALWHGRYDDVADPPSKDDTGGEPVT